MNMEKYKALTDEQAEILIQLLAIHQQDKEALAQIYDRDIKEDSFVCKVIEKRISAFKLAPFEPSALLFIDILSEGNPGRAVLMLIETLEAFDKAYPKPPIDIDFLAGEVYPWGFYTEAAFEKEWDARKLKAESYNWLIEPCGLPASTPQQEPERHRIVNWKNG